jgi:ubiquitin carboxyl-terminal hydrolase 5/13
MERAVDWLFSHPDVPEEPAEEVGNQYDIAPANYQLFALISHKGTTAQCGHYVAFVKKGDQWVLFNDEKVVHVPDISVPAREAYIYVYQRIL